MKLLLYMFKHGRENFGYGPKNLADIGFLKGVQEQQTVPKDVGHYGMLYIMSDPYVTSRFRKSFSLTHFSLCKRTIKRDQNAHVI